MSHHNIPIRKNHGSISSTDSGHSEAMSFCEGNIYQLTSSILHNAPTVSAPLPPRRHSAVQQGSNPSNSYHPNNSSSTKAGNTEMPPPPNPRNRSVAFPVTSSGLPNASLGAHSSGYIFTSQQQQQYNQMRHAGMSI
jgi:hypothetical protein